MVTLYDVVGGLACVVVVVLLFANIYAEYKLRKERKAMAKVLRAVALLVVEVLMWMVIVGAVVLVFFVFPFVKLYEAFQLRGDQKMSRIPRHLEGMGVTRKGDVFTCVHGRQLSNCATCAPLAIIRWKALHEDDEKEKE